jgi:flagellar assembly protein FliH
MFKANPLLQAAPSAWVAELGTFESSAFRAWSEDPPPQPAAADIEEPACEAVPAEADLAVVQAEAFAAGFDEGRRSLEAEIASEREDLARLAQSLSALTPEPPEPLAALLSETVERLVREIVGTAAVDGELLRRRAAQAAALIGEETEPGRLFLHPEDLVLLEGAELPVALATDPLLARGSVRLERASGWIEDGPEVRLDRLRAALSQLGARA